jgi:hypothetical protein
VAGHCPGREGGSALRLQFAGLVRRTPKAAFPAYQQVGGQMAGKWSNWEKGMAGAAAYVAGMPG